MEKNKKLTFVKVQILNCPIDELTYKFAREKHNVDIQIEDIVKIPLKNKIKVGIVKSIHFDKPNFKVKCIKEVVQLDRKLKLFIKILSSRYLVNQAKFLKRIFAALTMEINTTSVDNIQNDECKGNNTEKNKLNGESDKSNEIIEIINKSTRIKPIFIFGNNYSGKTISIIDLIKHYIKNKKTAVVICPSNEDAVEFKNRLYKTINMSDLISNQRIIIGSQLPVFTTEKNIGIYIIFNEHSEHYNEKIYPFINTKDAMILRARIENIPIILTSPTPSINSWHKIKNKRFFFHTLNLNKTQKSKMSKIKHVQITKKNTINESKWFSKTLYNSIYRSIENNKICALIINRKGVSSNIRCKDCNEPVRCNICGYIYSLYKHNICICHKCKNKNFIVSKCVKCKSQNNFYSNDIGAIQVEKITRQIFKNINTKLIDSSSEKKLDKVKKDIDEKKINIIIGTDAIFKLIKTLNVGTIGMICADSLQRHNIDSTGNIIRKAIELSKSPCKSTQREVIIQTKLNPYEYNFLESINEDFSKYCNFELKFRKENQLPPFNKTCIIAVFDKTEESAQIKAKNIQSKLSEDKKTIFYKTLTKVILKNNNGCCFLIYGKGNSLHYLKENFKKTILENPSIRSYTKFFLNFNLF
jgi:primosomal protein N' (replication factor Y) (superfamily II helicase)